MNTMLITGASGFVGKNILPLLSESYDMKTLGLFKDDDYTCDLEKEIPILDRKFDVVFHVAGKAHVSTKSINDIKSFYNVNYKGTMNLCNALEQSEVPRNFIFISSVAVYGLEYGENITEDYPLNGNSAYARSKILAEEFLIRWCSKNNVILTILRPSLIAGPQPPGNLGNMIKGIQNGKYISIAKGRAKKSVLMVQDIANLLPLVINKGGVYNVCDSDNPSFRDLERIISSQLGKRMPYSIPIGVAKILACIGDVFGDKAPINTRKFLKITQSLTFSNVKIRTSLNWKPTSVKDNFKL